MIDLIIIALIFCMLVAFIRLCQAEFRARMEEASLEEDKQRYDQWMRATYGAPTQAEIDEMAAKMEWRD
jgi:hypothetical protein